MKKELVLNTLNYNKVQAARVLSDEIGEIDINMDKAVYMLQEMLELYFRDLDSENKDDRNNIIYDFNKYRTHAEIIDDYMSKVRDSIKSLAV